jgi:hypothetical protein
MQEEAGNEKEEETELTLREKDAGDLFGIRAIEAGYYGGVAQSRGNSMANSLVGTPNLSVTDFSKSQSSFGLSATDFSKSRNSVNYLPDPRSRTFSASSSILRLSQFGMGDMAESHGSTGQRSHIRTASALSHTPEAHNASKRNSTSPTKVPNVKLRPSTAQQNKRHTHSFAVNMDLVVPPSPVLQIHPPSRRESPSPPSPSLPPTPPLDASYTAAIFRQPMIADHDSLDDHALPSPELIGKMPFEVTSSENPYSKAQSVRGSVVSWIASSNGRSSPPPTILPPVPVPSIRLPAFPVKAVIDSSSPKFSGFVKERSHKEHTPGSTTSRDNGKKYFELSGMYHQTL